MEKEFFQNKIIKQILEKYKVLWTLNYLGGLCEWDMMTYMPKKAAFFRAEAMANLGVLRQKIFLDENFVKLIEQAEKEEGLNDYELAIVNQLKRALKHYKLLPPEFLEELDRTTCEAHEAWEKARKKNDFSIFEPLLERVIDLARKEANYLGYKEHPYDALLDIYEEGLTTKEVEDFFTPFIPKLKELLEYVKKSKNYSETNELEEEPYDTERMKELNKQTLEFLNIDPEKIRLDISVHPFTLSLGANEARITTRYHQKDFLQSLASTIHEFGHALYETQTISELTQTPIGGVGSVSLHESQSRLWEKMVGHNKEFIKAIYPEIIKISPKLENYSVEEMHRYFVKVRPSLIRTEADEITYHFHILIRFEIERDLLSGKIKVKDLPIIWNDKYKEYLGVVPSNDNEGILQDSHWAGGNIGYFPTYSIGTVISAIWKYHLEKDLGEISTLAGSKEGIAKIQEWLKEHVHKYGAIYTMKEILQKSVGEELGTTYFLDYLNKKYKEIY